MNLHLAMTLAKPCAIRVAHKPQATVYGGCSVLSASMVVSAVAAGGSSGQRLAIHGGQCRLPDLTRPFHGATAPCHDHRRPPPAPASLVGQEEPFLCVWVGLAHRAPDSCWDIAHPTANPVYVA